MNFKRYFGEGTLIIFSVLFALFINKAFDSYQTQRQKTIAIESIQKELYRNQVIIKRWKEQHVTIRNRITDILTGKNDSLKTEFEKYSYFNLGLLTNNESLMDAFLTNTAWEAAKSTGIIAEFDFNTTQKLTHVYTMQKVITERSMMKIIDYYFETSSHEITNLDQIMVQFQLRFWELTGQEELMVSLYEEALEAL